MGQITVRLSAELQESLKRACGGNLAGFVREVLEREVGEGKPTNDKLDRAIGRIDALEDEVAGQRVWIAEMESIRRSRKQPKDVPFRDSVHVELDGGNQ